MGNILSNAAEGHYPTYEYRVDQGKLVLCVKYYAAYDFEELKFRSEEEAALEIPALLEPYWKRRIGLTSRKSKKLRQK